MAKVIKMLKSELQTKDVFQLFSKLVSARFIFNLTFVFFHNETDTDVSSVSRAISQYSFSSLRSLSFFILAFTSWKVKLSFSSYPSPKICVGR